MTNEGDDAAPRRRSRIAETGTRALLDAFVTGDPDELLRLRDLLAGLGRRSFGMLLFIAVLPAFIPIPIGGAISGPLVVLIGAQLLIGMRRPWLPKFIGDRGPHRHALARFHRTMSPWLGRLEKLVRPRLSWLLDHRAAAVFTGLQLLLLGLLLALPIPLTNYVLGGLLLMYALALLERDGALMVVAWIAGVIAIVIFGVASGSLAEVAAGWIGKLI
jgi:hypothetical protein